MPIFLCTDNKETQDSFIKKYGDRLTNKNPSERQIDIETALIDILITSKCKYFKGTTGSSFSNTIENLQ